MVQKPVLNNVKKGTGQREVRPVWTNAMRVNHQKISNSRRNFAPTAVLTKSGLVPFSTARENFSRTASLFNTAVHKPFVNIAKPRTNAFQKSHSSLRRPFYQQTVLKNRMTSAVGEQGINAVKPTAYWAWRPKVKMINHVYKNTGSCICKQFNYVDPTGRNKVLNSPYFMVKSWLVHDQTVLALTIPRQTATGYTLESGDDSPKLIELMDLCTKLIDKVTILENALKQSKETHAQTLTMLMKKVKRLEDKLNLVQERFKDHPLEGHDLDLQGDLRMIFDPNKEDDIWLNQQYWELLRLKLHEYSGVHSLFLDGTSIQINMLVEKKYLLKKEILKKMIN
ncbi:hypothetical protein Tco_0937161 [Tanacetum coccineum]|uniref:Uncharacterized protein n=1 Tax=Tanacetum coccineum TaxID=301880 RepID=A0ABQ5DDJ4_9ASTR